MAMKFEKLGQDYHKAKYECIHSFQLYEDPDFPADDGSLFYSVNHKRNIVWKRPPELVPNPLMFHDKDVTCQVELGAFSNCWIVAAFDAIAQHTTLLYNAVPVDQNFSHDYVGMFRFRIWKYGTWYEVTIDDKLPYDTEAGVMYGMRSKLGDFWAPLMEKAYAKVLGKYEELTYVMSNDGIVDLTSGIGEMYSMKNAPELIFYIIRAAIRNKSLLLAYRDDRVRQPHSRYPWVHVFVTDMQKVEKPPPRARLNVWGFFVRIKATIPMVFDKEDDNFYHKYLADHSAMETNDLTPVEGEDWIVFEAFRKLFYLLSVVDLPSSSKSPVNGVGGINQQITEYNGSWVSGVNAGGSIADEKFSSNPKHYFTLEDPDEGFKHHQTVVVALMQKHRKFIKHSRSTKMEQIGYFIYAVPEATFRSKRIEWFNPEATSKHFAVQEVTKRFKLRLGTYMVVPCTYKRDRPGSYLLRILVDQHDLNKMQRVYRKVRTKYFIMAQTLYEVLHYVQLLAAWILVCAGGYLLAYLVYKIVKRRFEVSRNKTG